ncbi:MAG: succinyl-CoA--3-ketoacid-CoA transferase [Bdellovibrionaceae bacterium]|nr:succinyl-CoA--3-ketoacid-CoA transferase [Pseudobdellovibrionaceae bacterium]|tara:strand:+ start:18357 stop:19013 length:657 start_codon:yes stop_codon:yes gene_type:complete
MPLTRDQIAKRISQEVEDGFVVNLGIGIPTLVANYIPENMFVMLQSENGLLGMGPFPTEDKVDADLINAGKQTITAVDGSAFFDSATSFAMIRGGHVDLTVLGAMQVDQSGNIANWMIPGKMVKGMGGAMDLVAGAKKVVVAMQHVDKHGNSKLLEKCDLPFTGLGCIQKVVTDYGVLEIDEEGFCVKEYAPDLSPEEVAKATAGKVRIAEDCKVMEF